MRSNLLPDRRESLAESLQEENDDKRKHEKKINRASVLSMFYDIAIGIFIKGDFKNALAAFDELMMNTCEIIRPERLIPEIINPRKFITRIRINVVVCDIINSNLILKN